MTLRAQNVPRSMSEPRGWLVIKAPVDTCAGRLLRRRLHEMGRKISNLAVAQVVPGTLLISSRLPCQFSTVTVERFLSTKRKNLRTVELKSPMSLGGIRICAHASIYYLRMLLAHYKAYTVVCVDTFVQKKKDRRQERSTGVTSPP